MAQHAWLDPGPFFFAGGSTAALLVHGFTGAPAEVRPLGEALARAGFTAMAPLLPGHGTSPEQLRNQTWPNWVAAVHRAYEELSGRGCDRVFAIGMSLGSLLAAELALNRPCAGLAMLSPAIFFASPLVKISWLATFLPIDRPQPSPAPDFDDPEADARTWCYEVIPGRAAHQVHLLNRHVKRRLPQLELPTLVVMSRRDASLKFESGAYVIDRVRSRDKTLVVLERSGHNVLVDSERERVVQQVLGFVRRLTPTS
ncbi:MAG: alpha/beta fold hydrolase [Deltaproteobacteria bacterium]|nr:alpha/beta fold hydrolase [Deltaproteobacteria bacterium]